VRAGFRHAMMHGHVKMDPRPWSLTGLQQMAHGAPVPAAGIKKIAASDGA
jgi:hypothetical protein